MKFPGILLLCLFSFSSFAESTARIEITPWRPVNCQVRDYAVVNWIYKLTKVSDTSEEAVFEFVTQYGSCVGGKPVPVQIDERIADVGIFRNEFVMPWHKEGASAIARQESDSELRVTLTFDKKVLFKKKIEKELSFFFRPGVKYGPTYWVRTNSGAVVPWQADLQFPWNVLVSVETNYQLKLQFM